MSCERGKFYIPKIVFYIELFILNNSKVAKTLCFLFYILCFGQENPLVKEAVLRHHMSVQLVLICFLRYLVISVKTFLLFFARFSRNLSKWVSKKYILLFILLFIQCRNIFEVAHHKSSF